MVGQQFESTFFSLLDQHNKLLEQLFDDKANSVNLIRNRSHTIYKNGVDFNSAKNILQKSNDQINNYFKFLYQILIFILTNSPNSKFTIEFGEEVTNSSISSYEQIYCNIIRSFIGPELAMLLAINCSGNSPDDWKYRLLIERYALLENILYVEKSVYIEVFSGIKRTYNPSAFGKNNFLKVCLV